MEIALSSRQACEVAGITYRQIDWWARTGVLRPSVSDTAGSGSRRRYSVEDVRLLAVLARLVDLSPRAELATIGRALDGLAVVEDWTGWVYVSRSGVVGRSPEILGSAAGWVLDLGMISTEVEDRLARIREPVEAAPAPAAPSGRRSYARPPARLHGSRWPA